MCVATSLLATKAFFVIFLGNWPSYSSAFSSAQSMGVCSIWRSHDSCQTMNMSNSINARLPRWLLSGCRLQMNLILNARRTMCNVRARLCLDRTLARSHIEKMHLIVSNGISSLTQTLDSFLWKLIFRFISIPSHKWFVFRFSTK